MHKKQNISLNLLKVLTILLIINSHSDILYPTKISFFASGGAIGNELFFLISGYLFSAKENVGNDIKRKFIRLYLPTYIIIVVTVLLGRLQMDSISSIVGALVWPTAFWFVGAILLYTMLLYLLIGIGINKKGTFILFGVVVFIVDILLYILGVPNKKIWTVESVYFAFIPYRSIYSFFSFVFGYYLKCNKDRVMKSFKESFTIVMALAFFASFYGFKWLLNRGMISMSLQIIGHPLTVLSALFIFLVFANIDLNSKLENTVIEKWINRISSLSLESYLVQFLVIAGIDAVGIMFPLNMIICIFAVLGVARMLHIVTSKINYVVTKKRS